MTSKILEVYIGWTLFRAIKILLTLMMVLLLTLPTLSHRLISSGQIHQGKSKWEELFTNCLYFSFVFVLDVSGSMKDFDRIIRLRQAVKVMKPVKINTD